MRRIPPDVEESILKRALEGDTYRPIAHDFGVTPSTVNRIVEDARKRMPDFDTLRGLSVTLKKYGLSVFDATRGCNLLDRLNKCGISSKELEEYVQLNERFLSEKALGEDFMSYAMRLMQLEQAYGKSYQKIVEDCGEKQKEAIELEKRKTDSETRLKSLNAETKRAEDSLAKTKSEIEKATTLHDGLAKIGIDKLAKLVKFTVEFESLGFNAFEMQKLARALRKLKEIGLDQNKLEKFIEEKGPLETQNNNLRDANEKLRRENTTLTDCNNNLLEKNSALATIDAAWKTGTVTVPCKSCNRPLTTAFRSREFYNNLMISKHGLSLWCPTCGPIFFYPFDIIFQIGWSILPAQEEKRDNDIIL